MAKKRGKRPRASASAAPAEAPPEAEAENEVDDDGYAQEDVAVDMTEEMDDVDDADVDEEDDGGDTGDEEDGEDFDDEEDFDNENVAQESLSQGKKRQKKGYDPLYALPTADEMNKLKNSHQGLFRENLLRMEVEEMLKEVRAPKGTESASRPNVEKFARGLKDLFFKIPATSSSVHPVTVASLRRDRVIFREPPLNTHREVSLDFTPPKHMAMVGSYLLNSFVDQSSYMMDISVTMPSECFVAKDYLDGRYFYKRFLYLGTLGKAIMDKAENKKVRVTWLNNDSRRPVLLVYDKGKYGEKCSGPGPCVRIIPSLCTTSCPIPASKLNPIRCNMRAADSGEDAGSEDSPPTPHYNNALLGERLFHSHFKLMYGFFKDGSNSTKAMCDAVILAKVWLKQREFGTQSCPDSLNGFVVTMMMIYLCTVSAAIAKKLGHGRMSLGTMTSLQMFRVWLDFVANHDLSSSPIMMPSLGDDHGLERVTPTVEGMKAFQDAFDVVFLDPSGRFNFTPDMSASAWRELSWEAKQSLELLKSSATHSFSHIFLSKISFYNKYDQYVMVNEEPDGGMADDDMHDDGRTAACGVGSGIPLHRLANKGEYLGKMDTVLNIMDTALCERVSEGAGGVRMRCSPCGIWDLCDDAGPSFACRSIVLGLSLNPETYLRLVDRGPAADDTEKAQAFARFWGDIAQVRRFQDGAIVQSVVWDQFQKSHLRHQIVGGIAKFILNRHLPESNRVWSAMTQVLGVLAETEGYTAAALNCEGKYNAGISPFASATLACTPDYQPLMAHCREAVKHLGHTQMTRAIRACFFLFPMKTPASLCSCRQSPSLLLHVHTCLCKTARMTLYSPYS
jgi:U3 small nucleolar RNA-associated protein 22